ncbi:hypothetical protein Sa4125_29980 [Aureimonas sp. SA4125]|uniref:hypothetical protein n=1 Tax=Aureimonas sp. SA4125 TaxID=2826993 RepID=UPI001CC36333|nr:hypothetical protein [Aureimonas sp. SA4125]BDA85456.1 hypothetical protein Sa4125_29980 [Aureimonas sp. SA4125]
MAYTRYTPTGIRVSRTPPTEPPPAVQRKARNDVILRNWLAVTGEARAKRILLAIQPTSAKIGRRSREGLRAAIRIIGTDPVDVRHVGGILRSMGSIPHLGNARLGYVDDEALWEDARAAMGIAEVAATRRRAASRTAGLLGQSLAVVEALLGVPEGERAVLMEREMA